VSLLRNNFGQTVGDDLLNEWLPAGSARVSQDPILQPCVLPASPGPIIDVAMLTSESEKSLLNSKKQTGSPNGKKKQHAAASLAKRSTGRGVTKKLCK
jgi:hypothetical protein